MKVIQELGRVYIVMVCRTKHKNESYYVDFDDNDDDNSCNNNNSTTEKEEESSNISSN
eukprot:CAMPEP_0194144176 /NCGR_PEP_ID=MMETSP0152-20130528/13251_1 /TAXON_ID=1049557 /ORGANISM="Thalassiothrix antarctica, Strain L6-D1" /LENGTH=57 /DNA_ID=CAMNT_0038843907 /DNA_START=711 /DNA_END=884 /DNA_ORIENTATION=-